MFTKILIANRGEIACRIIKTAKRMGICCVAIYSEADKNALHVKLADEAYCVGPAPSKESYLCGDKIIAIALQSGAQAIHPGYGFLSENAAFAEQCAKAKICFIGPPASAIAAMGSKSKAKQLMEKAKVPLLPGYHGDEQSLEKLQVEAEKIGYPVLLKAAAGGGGKGMRVVSQAHGFAAALDAAKREAKSSFADNKILIEKYLLRPRHIEIQVFADSYGNAVYLFERDCSIQRRHQKIVEEAPAPFMKAKLREQMGQAGVTCAQTIGYVGAGTVEFLVDEDGSFYFMEMNTRLQVEHPVTEFISQQDLVEWQLHVACGEKLPLTQKELAIHGHAIEVRIYAEDPNNDFLPSVGKIEYLVTPEKNAHVRIDSGIIEGDAISPYYDPMITKLIVWDQDRAAAITRLQQALADYQIVGVTTNLDLLSAIANHPAFIKGKLDTDFIQQYRVDLTQPLIYRPEIFVLACSYMLQKQNYDAQQNSLQSFDPFSPWNNSDQWRLNLPAQQQIKFSVHQQQKSCLVTRSNHQYQIKIDEQQFIVGDVILENDVLQLTINQQHSKANIHFANNHLYILYSGQRYTLTFFDPTQLNTVDTKEIKSTLTSPMPGKVIALLAKTGEQVKQGDGLAIVEAMKMEHTIHAPQTGTVKEWYFQVGDIVDEGVELLKFETS